MAFTITGESENLTSSWGVQKEMTCRKVCDLQGCAYENCQHVFWDTRIRVHTVSRSFWEPILGAPEKNGRQQCFMWHRGRQLKLLQGKKSPYQLRISIQLVYAQSRCDIWPPDSRDNFGASPCSHVVFALFGGSGSDFGWRLMIGNAKMWRNHRNNAKQIQTIHTVRYELQDALRQNQIFHHPFCSRYFGFGYNGIPWPGCQARSMWYFELCPARQSIAFRKGVPCDGVTPCDPNKKSSTLPF